MDADLERLAILVLLVVAVVAWLAAAVGAGLFTFGDVTVLTVVFLGLNAVVLTVGVWTATQYYDGAVLPDPDENGA